MKFGVRNQPKMVSFQQLSAELGPIPLVFLENFEQGMVGAKLRKIAEVGLRNQKVQFCYTRKEKNLIFSKISRQNLKSF